MTVATIARIEGLTQELPGYGVDVIANEAEVRLMSGTGPCQFFFRMSPEQARQMVAALMVAIPEAEAAQVAA